MNRRIIYWVSQSAGWLLYVALAGLMNRLSGNAFDLELLITLASVFVAGILSSHLYRALIIKLDWLKLSIAKLIPRVIPAILIFAALFHLLQTTFSILLIRDNPLNLDWNIHFQRFLGWTILFLIWSLIYFVFHFIDNLNKEKIKNLEWEAAKMEFELNKLKSQLNPHFMFNSMNTIKALVDENPKKAKISITQLSNILRNTLQMGKRKEIPFEEELGIVKDYLELEGARYEERLQTVYHIDPESANFHVPPLMIQTLAENAIKHGISKLTGGGTVEIATKVSGNKLHVRIVNSGKFNHSSNNGFGIESTRKRLQLLYGKEGHFSISNNNNNEVVAELVIPRQNLIEKAIPKNRDLRFATIGEK